MNAATKKRKRRLGEADMTPDRIAIARFIATRGRAWGSVIAESLSMSEDRFWLAVDCEWFELEFGGYCISRRGRLKLGAILVSENTTSIE